jgi:tetratricopeptide (TPR) repeat protein
MLKAEAEIPSFMSTSAKLYSKGLWLEQEELLKKAIDVETKLLGADSAIVAKLETKLAECYAAQRKFPQIRTLLTHALSVLEKHKHDDPSAAVRALNKLGQFDLDRGDYDNAEPELEKALKQARESKLKGDVLLLCLRSYADVLQQTNRVPAGDALDREADNLEKNVSLDEN